MTEDVKNIQSLTVCKKHLRQEIAKNDKLNQELRHQKYKRCLAMVLYCEALILNEFLINPEYIKWLGKWRKKWLKIAEQFKEDK